MRQAAGFCLVMPKRALNLAISHSSVCVETTWECASRGKWAMERVLDGALRRRLSPTPGCGLVLTSAVANRWNCISTANGTMRPASQDVHCQRVCNVPKIPPSASAITAIHGCSVVNVQPAPTGYQIESVVGSTEQSITFASVAAAETISRTHYPSHMSQLVIISLALLVPISTSCGRLGFDAQATESTESIVSAARRHSCGVAQGTLMCWGGNGRGELGLGDGDGRSSVTPLNDDVWLNVVAGEETSCALRSDRTLWCWGANTQGELGTGSMTPMTVPVMLGDAGWRQGAIVFFHSCWIRTDSTLWCWGENDEAQLGQGNRNDDYPSPTQVGVAADWLTIATGQGHTCGIREPGTLWCWGRNTESELGMDSGAPTQIRTPTQTGSADDWIDIAAGQQHTCGIRSPGTLWCWGRDTQSQLGLDSNSSPVVVPTRVGNRSNWAQVAVNTFHTCGVQTDGTLWCWGRGREGQLGLTADELETPTRVGMSTDWRSVSLGRFHSCGTKTDGSIWCTGLGLGGQLGAGNTDSTEEFVLAWAP